MVLLLLFLLNLRARRLLVELLVHLLQERHVVVELHEIERTIDVQTAVGVDGVAIRYTVLVLRATLPRIGGVVVGIGIDPVEGWQEVERQLIGSRKSLVVVERRTPVLDARPHGVLPGMILVGIEVLVHWRVRLLYLGVGGTLEVHVQVLRQVPAHRELSVPQELFAERERQLRVLGRFHVSLLQLIVVARHLGVEGHVLRQPVQSESLQDVEPLALVLQLLERLPSLIHRCPRVVERTTPVVLVLIHGGLSLRMLVGVTVGEGEVSRVVRHRMALGGNADTSVGDGEVGVGHLRHGDVLDGVALVLRASCVESVLQLHVGVERIVLRRGLLLGHAII